MQDISFKAEIEFQGSAKELEKTLAVVRDLPVKVSIGSDRVVFPPEPGGWPFPIARVLGPELIERLKSSKASTLSLKVVEGIDGGIRDAHVHLDDRIVILDKEQFVEVAAATAGSIARDIALSNDYSTVARAMRGLGR